MNNPSNVNDFLRLLTANQKPIYAFILGMVPNREDARDLYQETVLVMWAKFESFQPGTNFVGWGITIARFKILQARRKYRKDEHQFSQAALEAIQSRSDLYVNQIDDRTKALQGCISKLSPNDHDLVHMRYEKELDVKKIAEQFDRSVQSVYKRFARIHKALLECVRRALSRKELA